MHAFIFIFLWFNKNINIPKIDFDFFILLNEYVFFMWVYVLYAYVYVCTCVYTFENGSPICVYYMFMYMSPHVYFCTRRPDVEGGYHPQSISTLFFKTGSLIETRAHQINQSTWPMNFRDVCFCLQPRAIDLLCNSGPGFYLGVKDLNSISYAQ